MAKMTQTEMVQIVCVLLSCVVITGQREVKITIGMNNKMEMKITAKNGVDGSRMSAFVCMKK